MSKQHKKLVKPDTISPSKSFIKHQAATEKNKKKVKLFFSLLIGALAIAIYANSINNSYTLDDFSVIKENNIVKNGAKSIPLIFNSSYRYGYLNVNDGLYRPFTLMMYAIEWQIFPDKPAIYHLVNILLYALTGVVMFRLLCKALKQYNIILPLVATLLFIAHPIHTEVVANIKSRDEIMCFLFVLLSINYLFNYVNENKISQINNYYPNADNFELAKLGAHKQILMCMKKKGYDHIMKNKKEIHDCDTKYLNYNNLSWEELLKILL